MSKTEVKLRPVDTSLSLLLVLLVDNDNVVLSRSTLTMNDLKKRLESGPVKASAACRIDCGGTLDLKTFYYPLRHLCPCTFNIALSLKTRVTLFPYRSGLIKISSRGFPSEEYPPNSAPFDSPLGLMFAIGAYFRAEGVHIEIVSESPPRSALGGSSAAAVALVGALSRASGGENLGMEKKEAVLLAHAIEEGVAGVPCGLQDQLAAAYGGVHAWYWPSHPTDPPFKGSEIVAEQDYQELEQRLLVAYCGVPHESRNINTKWVRQFVTGSQRSTWVEIVKTTNDFVDAVRAGNWACAAIAMNREVEIRRRMTPEVFDEVGDILVKTALIHGCGARFTGAGGGGCIWAIGDGENIQKLRPAWDDILSQRKGAMLLGVKIDQEGLEIT